MLPKNHAYAVYLYNNSSYKKSPYMNVHIEQDLDRAADNFAVEILKALQSWHNERQIGIFLCTGDSPFIGYRKVGGDKLLQEKGLYNPRQYLKFMKKYERIGAILDTWDKPQTQRFLKSNGLSSKLKPDMKKVIAFSVDAIFPQKRSEYFAFANQLNNICDLWNIPKKNRHFFYGDIYVTKQDGHWKINRIPNEEFKKIIESTDGEGLKILEYHAACLQEGRGDGFALNSPLKTKMGMIMGRRLKRTDTDEFCVEEIQIEPLNKEHIQYRYLESMQNQARMMHEKLTSFGGTHITLLGVGPSYEGEGHIGFCEKGTPFEQTCFIGGINDFDSTFHIAGAHAKEFYGLKKMFVTLGNIRLPKFGFITYGPADLMYRQVKRVLDSDKKDISKEVIVIVIATGNYKSRSVAKAIEEDYDLSCPLSLTQESRGVYILDKTSARELRVEKYPPEFEVSDKEFITKEAAAKKMLSRLIRPNHITDKLEIWNISKGDNILLINPHMDDDFLAMMHLLKEMSPFYNIHACYTSLGYTAVYSDYILGLLEIASKLSQNEIENLNQEIEKELLKELIAEGGNFKSIPHLDYEVLPYMSEKEKLLRAKILLIALNERYDLKKEAKDLLRNKFRSSVDLADLGEFLAEVEARKPQGSGLDLDIMRFLKTSVRFTETTSALIFLGIPYNNIYWPLDVSFYGTPGRPLAIKEEDINKIKRMIKTTSPKLVIFNGEGFPDFGSHSNTEIGTYLALFELLKQREIKNNLVLFQWAGVWDRIGVENSQIGLVLTEKELEDFSDSFNYFYRTQAPYAPAPNPSSAHPQPFSYDVIINSLKSAKELLALIKPDRENIPKDLVEILDQGGGLLHYKIARLKDAHLKQEFLKKQEALMRSSLSIDVSSNTALVGPAPYPERLYELPSSLVSKMYTLGAVSENDKKVFSYTDAFKLTTKDLLEAISAFHKEMEQGLEGKRSSLAMLPTFVGNITGEEKGTFLALDLGGSIFRVLLVRLPDKDKKLKTIIEKYNLKATEKEKKRGVSYDCTQGSAYKLFTAIVGYIEMFLKKHAKRMAKYGCSMPYNLGFTFSFSITKKAIDQAIVNKLSKEFNIPDLINKDAVLLLRKAINQAGLKDTINVLSLNNDTVATLVAERYHELDCDIGGIVGTGTNFCYIEQIENIKKLPGNERKRLIEKTMIINIESGNFNKITQNLYDKLLDDSSVNKGEHLTEKMVSGLYLGELTRYALLDLIDKGLLFNGRISQEQRNKLLHRDSFPSPLMTEIIKDESRNLKKIHKLLTKLGINKEYTSLEDKINIKYICKEVIRRAARITAAVVFAIVTHMDKQIQQSHTIAIDGSLFEKNPTFKQEMQKAIEELSEETFKDERAKSISLKLSPGGSGIGAAIIAATKAISAIYNK